MNAPDFVTIFVDHILAGAGGAPYEYDPPPQGQGPIHSIDNSEDRMTAQHAVYGTLAIRQSGIVYVLSNAVLPQVLTNVDWQTVALTGLTANQFERATGFTSALPIRPDFSAAGAPIQFGFTRGSTARFQINTIHAIDNWRVTIHRQPPPLTGR